MRLVFRISILLAAVAIGISGFRTPVAGADATALRADTAEAPRGVCLSDTNTYSLVSAALALGNTPAGAAVYKADLVTLSTFLTDRINACKFAIARIPLYAKDALIAQYGQNQNEENCASAALPNDPKSPQPTEILDEYDRLTQCYSFFSALTSIQLPSFLFHAKKPAIYVIMDSQSTAPSAISASQSLATGASSNAASSSSKNSSASSNAGTASGSSSSNGNSSNGLSSTFGSGSGSNTGGISSSTGTGSIDNAGALLLYDIAIRLGPPWKVGTTDQDEAFFVPATQWTLANYYNQCLADPPVIDEKTRQIIGGTYGAIVIDESTTTNGGQFGLAFVNGWSVAKFSAELVQCTINPDFPGQSPNTVVWHGYAEGKSYRFGLSFLPLATWLTFLSTKWNGGTNTVANATTSLTTPQFVLAYFLGQTAGVTIGDTGTTMTVPRAYDNAAGDLLGQLNGKYCATANKAVQDGSPPDALCYAIANLHP